MIVFVCPKCRNKQNKRNGDDLYTQKTKYELFILLIRTILLFYLGTSILFLGEVVWQSNMSILTKKMISFVQFNKNSNPFRSILFRRKSESIDHSVRVLRVCVRVCVYVSPFHFIDPTSTLQVSSNLHH